MRRSSSGCHLPSRWVNHCRARLRRPSLVGMKRLKKTLSLTRRKLTPKPALAALLDGEEGQVALDLVRARESAQGHESQLLVEVGEGPGVALVLDLEGDLEVEDGADVVRLHLAGDGGGLVDQLVGDGNR